MNIKLIYDGIKGDCRQYKVENAEFITVVLVKENILKDEKFAAFDTNDGKMLELPCTFDGNSIETSIYKLDSHLHDEDIERHVNTVVRKELEKRLCKQADFKEAPQSVNDEMLDRLCHELLEGEYGVKDNIICDYELESIRLCDQCGELMHKGYVVNGCEAFCSRECIEGYHGKRETEEILAACGDDDSETYWTQWE